MIIGIIGGGASGMAAALAAAEDPNNQVLLIERQARVGRKLLATGNGRCNLSNLHACADSYHGTDGSFAAPALKKHSPEETLAWFSSLGLYCVTQSCGKVYPYSDQANSVVDILRLNLQKPNISLISGCQVEKIKKLPQGFALCCDSEEYFCHRVIVACGGLAGTKLGGSMSGYKLLGKFGHRSSRLRPALVQLKSDWSALASLKGIRAECAIEILHNGSVFAQNRGQLQFTEYGISGPVVFEISRDVCACPGQWLCRTDFVPELSENDLLGLLLGKAETQLPVSELLTGIVHNRLGRVLTQASGLDGSGSCSRLSRDQLAAVCTAVKAFEIRLTEPMGMDSAQVTAGGVLTEQFDPDTMQSLLVPGLYACGEVLDIDGDCGGYNLQWAWSSGRLAGESAGRE